jgi:hypothetical protein
MTEREAIEGALEAISTQRACRLWPDLGRVPFGVVALVIGCSSSSGVPAVDAGNPVDAANGQMDSGAEREAASSEASVCAKMNESCVNTACCAGLSCAVVTVPPDADIDR